MYKKKRGTLKPHNSSVVLHLKPLFIARNILHPSTFLLKIGISNSSVTKMLKEEAVQVNFKQLTALCVNLNCTPNDIFALREMKLPEHHALNALKPITAPDEKSITEWLTGKSIAEIQELMKK